MLSTNGLDSLQFFYKKALNFVQVIKVSSLPQWQYLYYVQYIIMFPQSTKAAKRIWLAPMAPAVSR